MPNDGRIWVVEQHTVSDVVANDYTAAGDENGPCDDGQAGCIKGEPCAIFNGRTFSDPLELSCRSGEAACVDVSLLRLRKL